jgi:hypothetical protein
MSQSETPNFSFVAITLVVFLYAASLVQRVLYNIYRHPLAHIPGPKLAAATYIYQTYFSFHNGKSRYYIQIADLHKKYGKNKILTITRR